MFKHNTSSYYYPDRSGFYVIQYNIEDVIKKIRRLSTC